MGELIGFLTSLEFASPLYFLASSGAIIFFIFFTGREKRRKLVFDWGYYKKKKIKLQSKRIWLLLFLIVVVSLVFASALGNLKTIAKRSISSYEKPVLVALDVSGSMISIYTEGLSKFKKTREVFYDIKRQDLGANIGLMLFSGDNYIARDFVPSIELLEDTVENDQEIDKISGGTEIAKALAAARVFFTKNLQAKSKSIILISDLEDIFPPIAQEIDKDSASGIKVYAIVIEADPESAHEKIYALKDNLKNKEVRMVWVEDKNGISQIYEEIKAEKGSLTGKEEVISKRSIVIFLFWGLTGLMALIAVFSETIFRKVP